jgi:hypothetical protein
VDIGHELLEAVDRQVSARREQHRQIGQQGGGHKLRRRIVRRISKKKLILGVRADVADHKLVTIGRCFGDPRYAGNPSDAGHVLNQNRLPKSRAKPRNNEACHQVG